MAESPLVDILVPVYNHEKFIAQCIESIVAQQANFKYRLIIGEDKSPDHSREIIEKYAQQYPDIIYPVYHENNLGATANSIYLYSLAKAKYIAICEGDDYWIDPLKLQKQFDFLEGNPEFSMCFTKAGAIDDNGKEIDGIFPVITKDEFSIEDVVMAEMVFIPSATLFFRNVFPATMPQFYVNAFSGDVAIHLMLADKGKFKCLPGETAIYRSHAGGITKSEQAKREGDSRLFDLFVSANEYFGYRYNKIFRARLLHMSKVKLIYKSKGLHGLSKLRYIARNASDYFKYSDKVNLKEVLYYSAIIFFPSFLKLKK